MTAFRWKGAVPLALCLLLILAAWYFFADTLVERAVERGGAQLVGAQVDVVSADVRLQVGTVRLQGLAVTNPDRPMTNLFEAEELLVDLRMAPLLEKKVIIDTVAVRGLRFGTRRETSGAIEGANSGAADALREVRAWRARTRLPEFSLAGLGRAVNIGALRPESLLTLAHADAIRRVADSSRTAWLGNLRALNPEPTLDSARALGSRLETASLPTLGLSGVRDAVTSARRVVGELSTLDDRLRALQQSVEQGVGQVRAGIGQLDDRLEADYRAALARLQLPSLDAPNLAPALFGNMALDRIVPVLAWLQVAERYLPPGVRTRLRAGPERARRAGTDVVFPRQENLPTFLLLLAEASLQISGGGGAAGNYVLRVADVTSAPALLGRPTTFDVARTGGQAGPRTVRLSGTLNHVTRPLRDSIAAVVTGLALPTIDLGPLGARLRLGEGDTELVLRRVGDSLDARWSWRASSPQWDRLANEGRVQDLLWRTVSGVRNVEIEARLTGSLGSPRLAVGSNVARVLAASLREQLGAEIRRAEQLVRARVDSVVQTNIAAARAAVGRVEQDVRDRIAAHRRDAEQLRTELEARIRALVRIPGVGG